MTEDGAARAVLGGSVEAEAQPIDAANRSDRLGTWVRVVFGGQHRPGSEPVKRTGPVLVFGGGSDPSRQVFATCAKSENVSGERRDLDARVRQEVFERGPAGELPFRQPKLATELFAQLANHSPDQSQVATQRPALSQLRPRIPPKMDGSLRGHEKLGVDREIRVFLGRFEKPGRGRLPDFWRQADRPPARMPPTISPVDAFGEPLDRFMAGKHGYLGRESECVGRVISDHFLSAASRLRSEDRKASPSATSFSCFSFRVRFPTRDPCPP
jgi:hypothetical protein